MNSSSRLIDITLKLFTGMPVYPGDPPPMLTRTDDLQETHELTTTTLQMSCHTGTHIDAPSHFLPNGWTLDNFPLESFYGPAVVIDLCGKTIIHAGDVEDLDLPQQHHILLKTDNSLLWRQKTYARATCVISPSAAEFLTTCAPLSIGFDHYCLDPCHESGKYPSHVIFAHANLPVFVALDLFNVTPGDYTFIGFPLRLSGVEGAPVRAILRKDRR